MQYRERVLPPLPLQLLAAALAGSFGFILVPLSVGLAIAVALTLALLAGLVVYLSSPLVMVDGQWLQAGAARIEGHFLARVEVLDKAAVRAAMGTGADARAYTSHRDYAAGGVRVELLDPRDPAPYWLISSNQPAELAARLRDIAAGDAGRPGA